MDHTETSSTPSERCRTLAKGGQKRISFPSALTPVVAPNLGWLGSNSASSTGRGNDRSFQEGTSSPATTTTSLQSRKTWKLGLVPTSRFLIIVAAM